MTRSTCPSGGDETRGVVPGGCCALCRYLGQAFICCQRPKAVMHVGTSLVTIYSISFNR